MRLELRYHQVRDMAWGPDTRLSGGLLRIDKAGLQAELLRDERLSGVDFDLAHPGESCRLVQVFDVIEPRAKLDPPGIDFPGILGPVRGVGHGVTRVLRGAAVTVIDPTPPPPQLGRGIPAGHVIDMAPSLTVTAPTTTLELPGSDVSLYAGLHHLAIIPRLAEGVQGDSASNALRVAGVRAAAWLAQACQVEPPDEELALELSPVADGLPRVAYVYQLHSHQVPTVPGEPLLYGDNCRHLLPTIVHPNEILDGAVVRSYYHLNMETYGIQNNAVIHDLYRRHGSDICFAGVVVNVANQLAEERDRCTLMSANLVKWTLRADGAVLSKSIGGAPHVDMALVAERCEELGVRTVMLVSIAGEGEDSALFNSPSLDAIVSVASNGSISLGATERVISPSPELAELAQGPMSVGGGRFVGVSDHLGSSRLTGARY